MTRTAVYSIGFSLKCQSSIVTICCYFERYQAPVPATIASFLIRQAVKMQYTPATKPTKIVDGKLDKNI